MSVPRHHQHKETLNFGPFAGYEGTMSGQDGYGGFDYTDGVKYMNATYWQDVKTFWCDSGYQNVAAATGASSVGWIFEDGAFTTANPKETFDLKSFVAQSAWSSQQEWTVTTYNGTTKIGAMNFYASDAPGQLPVTVKLGKIGDKITSFSIVDDSGMGHGGNTCTYGSPAYGSYLAFGDMKIAWNGKIPVGLNHHSGHNHHVLPLAATPIHTASHEAVSGHQVATHPDTGYHTELQSLHHDGRLTSLFHLG